MTRKGLVFTAAAMLSAITVGGSLFAPVMFTKNELEHRPSNRVFQLMPAQSDEFSELTYLDADRKPRSVEVNYRDGRRGYRVYDAKHVLSYVRAQYADGSDQLWIKFDETGRRIIDGYERRADGSRMWSVSLTESETITTRFNDAGQAYSIEHRKLGQDNAKVEYFHNGKKWLEQSIKNVTVYVPIVLGETVWDETNPGFRTYVWHVDSEAPRVAISATYYRRGTSSIWYKQYWREYTSTPGDPELLLKMPGPGGATMVLQAIEVYGDDGNVNTKYEFDDFGNNVVVMRKPIAGTNGEQVYRTDRGDNLQVPSDFYHAMAQPGSLNAAWDKIEKPSF